MNTNSQQSFGLPENEVKKLHAALMRHFVALRWIDRTPGERAEVLGGSGTPMMVSGFLISVRDTWLLVTAGHILKDIETAIKKGQVLTEFRLDDAFHSGAEHISAEAMIPFDYDGAPKFFLDDDIGDYGCLILRPLYVELLKKNGALPIPEDYVHNFDGFEHFWVAGLPTELIQLIGSNDTARVRSVISLVALDRIRFSELPSDIKELHIGKKGEYLYCKMPEPDEMVQDNQSLTDIDGLSGGPIVGCLHDPEHGWGYALVAVQSGWFRNNRIIYGCGMLRLVIAVENVSAKLASQSIQM